MKVLITGANGFIGRNMVARLAADGKCEVLPFDKGDAPFLLEEYAKVCGFVLHLAGINRPQDEKEFTEGNLNFTSTVLELLKKHGNKCPVLMTSSVQAELENPYGISKKAAEEKIAEFCALNGNKPYIYRLPNVFGKWSRPNYNSAVATFCHNIARGLEITVSDRQKAINLAYIDDVVAEFLSVLDGKEKKEIPFYTKTLGEIVDLLYSFKASRENLLAPNQADMFSRVLYATYLSFLPENEFAYAIKMNKDARGSFTELIKTQGYGQVSVNVGKAGVVKGNHYHNTKNEKFIVVSGKALIKFRKVGESKVYEYQVSGENIEIIDIPCGYTHSITAVDGDSVTLMWANTAFDPENPDTIFEAVEK